MDGYRLLDSDLYINLVRTSVISSTDDLVKCFEETKKGKLLSSQEVKEEVYSRLKKTSCEERLNTFCKGKENRLIEIADRLFDKTKIIETHDCPLMKILQGTEIRNLGEKSLIAIMFDKYSNLIGQNVNNSITIVSNNQADVCSIIKKRILPLKDYGSKFNQTKNLRSTYEFYLELFQKRGISKDKLHYFIFVSNIDARYIDKNIMQVFRQIN